MNPIYLLVAANCVLLLIVIWHMRSIRKHNRTIAGYFMDLSTNVQNEVRKEMESTNAELEKANKKLDTVGKILTVFEDETKILQKRKEDIKKIQSRFQLKREPR